MSASFGSDDDTRDDTGVKDEQVRRAYLIIVLWDFIHRPTWDDALRFLEQHREPLLSDFTLDLLRKVIGAMRAAEREEEAAPWEAHLRVLEDVRRHGLAAVRKDFGRRDTLPLRLEW